MESFEKTFDNAAADYEQSRPSYPKAIYDDLFRYQPIRADSHVLEIGLGTGKATEPIVRTGCRFVGIEPGERLAAYAQQKLGAYQNFTLCPTTLQDFPCKDASFDLIYAATAFHHIPEEVGYKRVYALLKSGGAFARFAYHAGADHTRVALNARIRELYQAYMPRDREYREFSETDARKTAENACKYGFTDVTYKLYHWTKDFTADAYMMLLHTYSDHMRLEKTNREKLFQGIYEAIKEHGGVITVHYTADLELARKT